MVTIHGGIKPKLNGEDVRRFYDLDQIPESIIVAWKKSERQASCPFVKADIAEKFGTGFCMHPYIFVLAVIFGYTSLAYAMTSKPSLMSFMASLVVLASGIFLGVIYRKASRSLNEPFEKFVVDFNRLMSYMCLQDFADHDTSALRIKFSDELARCLAGYIQEVSIGNIKTFSKIASGFVNLAEIVSLLHKFGLIDVGAEWNCIVAARTIVRWQRPRADAAERLGLPLPKE